MKGSGELCTRPDEWIATLKARLASFAAEQGGRTSAIFPALEVFHRRTGVWKLTLPYFVLPRTARALATDYARLISGCILRFGYELVVVDAPTSGWVRLFKQRRVYLRAEGSETPGMSVTASQCNVDHLRHELGHIVLHEDLYAYPHHRHVVDLEARMLEDYVNVLLCGWSPEPRMGLSRVHVTPADAAGSEERLLRGAWRLYNLIATIGFTKVSFL